MAKDCRKILVSNKPGNMGIVMSFIRPFHPCTIKCLRPMELLAQFTHESSCAHNKTRKLWAVENIFSNCSKTAVCSLGELKVFGGIFTFLECCLDTCFEE